MRRILLSLGMVGGGILLSTLVFTTLRSFENKKAEVSFEAVAEERLDALETNIKLTINNLVSLGALYDASQNVNRDEFDRLPCRCWRRTRPFRHWSGFRECRDPYVRSMNRTGAN